MSNDFNIGNIVNNFLDRLRHCLCDYRLDILQINELLISPSSFLNEYFFDGFRSIVQLCKVSFPEVISTITTAIKNVVIKLSPESSIIDISIILLYLELMKSCLNSVKNSKIPDSIITDDFSILSDKFMSLEQVEFASEIQKMFYKLLASINNKNDFIYEFFAERYTKNEKDFETFTQLISHLSSNCECAEKSLKAIHNKIFAFSQNQNQMFSIINKIIRNAIKKSPESLDILYIDEENYLITNKFLSDLYVPNFQGQISLLLLRPNMIKDQKSTIESKISNLSLPITSEIEDIIEGLDTLFIALSNTLVFDAQILYDSTCAFINNNLIEILSLQNSHIKKVFFVNFPLAALNDDEYFMSKVQPILLKITKECTTEYFCRFLSKKKHMRYLSESINDSILNDFLLPTIDNIIEDPVSIKYLFRSFIRNPIFFSTFVDLRPAEFCMMIKNSMNSCDECADVLFHFFDINRIPLILINELLFKSIKLISQTLIDIEMLTTITKFTIKLPDIFVTMSHFVEIILQRYDSKIEYFLQSNITPILLAIEQFALGLLLSSLPSECHKAVLILSHLIQTMHSSNEQVSMSFDCFKAIVTNCKKRDDVIAIHPSIIYSLKLIKEDDESVKNIWDTIYSYVISALKIISPTMKLPEAKMLEIKKPVQVMQKEIPNCICFLLASKSNHDQNTFELIHQFLLDDQVTSKIVVDCIAASLQSSSYESMTDMIHQWIMKIQTHPGQYEVCQSNTILVHNSLNLMWYLIKQPSWDENSLKIQTFEQISLLFTSYCNHLEINEIHSLCSHFISAMMKRIGGEIDIDSRLQMANHLGMWVSKLESIPKDYAASLFDALSYLVNDIEFIDTKEELPNENRSIDQFRFFVSCAILALKDHQFILSDIQQFLISLFRNNLERCLKLCISQIFTSNQRVNQAFLAALATILKKPLIANEPLNVEPELSLFEILFGNNFAIIHLLIDIVPFSKTEQIAFMLVEAAVSLHIEYEFIDFMIQYEIVNTLEESCNALFRGNNIPARSVGYFPRLFGKEWLLKYIKPIIVDMIDQNEKKNTKFDLVENQENFTVFLNTMIDAIIDAIPKLPDSIIKVVHMLAFRIEQKFSKPGLSIQIIFGLLFLRFILPTFHVTKLLDLPALLPDEQRQCLLGCSVILMASSVKSNLSEKGAKYEPYKNIAKEASVRLEGCIQNLLNGDVSILNLEPIAIDVEHVTNKLTTDLQSIIQPLSNKIDEMKMTLNIDSNLNPISLTSESSLLPQSVENSSSMRSDEISNTDSSTSNISSISVTYYLEVKLLTYLTLNAPQKTDETKKSDIASNATDDDSNHSTVYIKLMNADYSKENLNEFGDWFFFENGLFYLITSKVPRVSDKKVLLYYIFSEIQKVNTKYSVLIDISNCEVEKYPKVLTLYYYLINTPKRFYDNLEHCYIVNPESNIISHLIKRKQLINNPKVVFVKELKILTVIFGKLSNRLTKLALESLTTPDSIQTGTLNGCETLIRIHEKSVQFVQEYHNSFFSQIVIPLENISNISENSQNNHLFTITLQNNVHYTIKSDMSSSLFSLIRSAVAKMKALEPIATEIDVEKSTIQWLLLNLSLAVLSNSQEISITKAAIHLLENVYLSYSFNHSFNIFESDLEERFDSISLVKIISKDISSQNQESTISFLNEYFKMIDGLPNEIIERTLFYIEEWIPYFVDILNNKKLDHHLMSLCSQFISLENKRVKSLQLHIWKYFNTSKVFKILLNQCDSSRNKLDSLKLESNNMNSNTLDSTSESVNANESIDLTKFDIFMSIAQSHPELLNSKASEMINSSINENDLRFRLMILNSLVTINQFDISQISDILYQLIILYDSTSNETRNLLAKVLMTVLSVPFEYSEKADTGYRDRLKVYAMYVHEFSVESDMLQNKCKLANFLSSILVDILPLNYLQQLFDFFYNNIQNAQNKSNSSGESSPSSVKNGEINSSYQIELNDSNAQMNRIEFNEKITSIVFALSLANKSPSLVEYVKLMSSVLHLLNYESDDFCLIFCLSLSKIKLSEKYSHLLFIISIIFILSGKVRQSAFQLLNSVLIDIDLDFEQTPVIYEILKILQNETSLPFVQNLPFAVFALIGLLDVFNECKGAIEKLVLKYKYYSILSIQKIDQNVIKNNDFGELNSFLAAVICNRYVRMPKHSEIILDALKLMPDAFRSIKWMSKLSQLKTFDIDINVLIEIEKINAKRETGEPGQNVVQINQKLFDKDEIILSCDVALALLHTIRDNC